MQNSKNTKYSGVTEKFNMELMTNYNNHIFEVALNYLKNVKKCVDFGAGIGTLALIFREKFNISPVCIEIDEDNIDYLKKRKFEFFRNLKSAPTENDLIFSSNVLEHIKDDQDILKLMKKKLKKNGILLLEGGSKERDNVEWMTKYNKPKINNIINKYKNKYEIITIGTIPSITIIKSFL